MNTWANYDTEREALCKDLAGLDPAQWDTQSLCSEWQVRHVVAHLVVGTNVRAGEALLGLARNGMNFNRFMGRQALAAGTAAPSSLLTGLHGTIGTHKAPPGAKPVNMLIDTVCHSADIRRPLGINRALPAETLIEVADGLRRVGFPVGARKRVAGIRLVATDVEWSAGDGPVVEGPAESLILAMGGRPAGLDDLAGDGIGVLAARM